MSLLQNECRLRCFDGEAHDKPTYCYKCLDNCKICEFGRQCITCNNTFYMSHFNTSCDPNTCLNRQGLETKASISQQGRCLNCPDHCQKCDEDYRICTLCDPKYFLSKNNTVCHDPCPKGQFEQLNANNNHTCEYCSPGCQDCDNFQSCKECNSTTFLMPDKTKCVDKCPTGTYKNSDSNKCSDCIAKCDLCENNKVCQFCSKGSFLNTTSKICFECDQKYFYGNQQTRTCDLCHRSCLRCSGSSDKECLLCEAPYTQEGS